MLVTPAIRMGASRRVLCGMQISWQTSQRNSPPTVIVPERGVVASGPAMRAAKNPSSSSTFIALPPLQPLRKSPRRSSSASVRGSVSVKALMGISGTLGKHLRYYRWLPFAPQASQQPRVPPLRSVVADRDAQRLLLPDQHKQPLAPRDPRVDQVALEQHVVLGGKRDHHCREL